MLLFDQVSTVPLLFKVSILESNVWCESVSTVNSVSNNLLICPGPPQLTAFAYKDYLEFGYVDQGLSETANLLKQFNINTYAPTMLVFKENTDKPADIIQVWLCSMPFLLGALLPQHPLVLELLMTYFFGGVL